MMDQQAKFAPRGVTTEFVGEAQSDPAAKVRVLKGEAQLVFISPESILNNEQYRSMLLSGVYKEKLVALVVDEAHCVKTWGDEFRTAFSKIGSLRSLIPSNTNVMALTATCTTELFDVVTQRLAMESPTLVAMSPSRDNIAYCMRPKTDLEEFAECLSCELKEKHTIFPKTVVFVRHYKDCSDLYLTIRKKMGPAFTDPPHYPDHSNYRIVDMYTRASTVKKREQLLAVFSSSGGILRLLIATTAFGMGVDCVDIRRIMHWGSTSSLEEYVQETGRAGRDGLDANAIMFHGKENRHANVQIKEYRCNDSVCRRRCLFKNFLMHAEQDIKVIGSKCCDICAIYTK